MGPLFIPPFRSIFMAWKRATSANESSFNRALVGPKYVEPTLP